MMFSYAAIFFALAQVFKKFTTIKNWIILVYFSPYWSCSESLECIMLMSIRGIGEGWYHNFYVWCTKEKPSVHH